MTGSGLAKGMTVSQVLGYGNQRGFAEFVRGQRIVPTLLAKVKVEIETVTDDSPSWLWFYS